MNGCEFCGLQDSNKWIKINEESRLFCSDDHGIKFNNILKSIKFHAGWSTIEMLISKKISEGWNCKAFRGMADLEFNVKFDLRNDIVKFDPIFQIDK